MSRCVIRLAHFTPFFCQTKYSANQIGNIRRDSSCRKAQEGNNTDDRASNSNEKKSDSCGGVKLYDGIAKSGKARDCNSLTTGSNPVAVLILSIIVRHIVVIIGHRLNLYFAPSPEAISRDRFIVTDKS